MKSIALTFTAIAAIASAVAAGILLRSAPVDSKTERAYSINPVILPVDRAVRQTRCNEKRSHTFRESSGVRIFELTRDVRRRTPTGIKEFEYGDMIACLKSTGFWMEVFKGEYDYLLPDQLWMKGTTLAYLMEDTCADICDPMEPYGFEVLDLAKGTDANLESDSEVDLERTYVAVVGIGNGFVVYGVDRPGERTQLLPSGDVRTLPAGREVVAFRLSDEQRTVLDRGQSIDVDSVRLRDSTVSWKNGSGIRRVTIR